MKGRPGHMEGIDVNTALAEERRWRQISPVSAEMDIEDNQLTPKTVTSSIAAPRASAPPIAAPRTRSLESAKAIIGCNT
ncbi:uncharacterized protein LOC120780600 isoform X2 [Bactrocera tryoni]|uniref:uncharacterized protein LOC120780600 isoform X2 n=1 Tax=Bactrocera tryoni TaxID=59916 RepID=UPI001A978DA6|nr:uncharacterized protein LOC120780600 isoform X2 [Bactrocera tryoni]